MQVNHEIWPLPTFEALRSTPPPEWLNLQKQSSLDVENMICSFWLLHTWCACFNITTIISFLLYLLWNFYCISFRCVYTTCTTAIQNQNTSAQDTSMYLYKKQKRHPKFWHICVHYATLHPVPRMIHKHIVWISTPRSHCCLYVKNVISCLSQETGILSWTFAWRTMKKDRNVSHLHFLMRKVMKITASRILG
jgi:hypothetical protein